MNYFSKSL